MKMYEVSTAAHNRGYGMNDEIRIIRRNREPWSFDLEKYIDLKLVEKERRSR